MAVGFHNFFSSMTSLKDKYQILPGQYVESYEGEKGETYFGKMIVDLTKSVTFFMVTISGMPTMKYWQTLKIILVRKKRISQKIKELEIHVLRHWQLFEVIYSLDIQKY